MSETKPTYAHGGPESPQRCPTCGNPVRIVNVVPEVGNVGRQHYEPLALDALERAVVEAAVAVTQAFVPEKLLSPIQRYALIKLQNKAVDALLAARAAGKGAGE